MNASSTPRRRVGRPSRISPARILAVARDIPSSTLTMPLIARMLGVQTAALYYHFESREALLTAMADQLVTEFKLVPPNPQNWRRWLGDTANELLRFMIENRSVLELPDWARLRSLSLPLVESVLQTLTQAGFSSAEAVKIWAIVGHLVHGSARQLRDEPEQRNERVATVLADGAFPVSHAAHAALSKQAPLEVARQTLDWLIAALPEPAPRKRPARGP